ncbi:MAG: hypothetical protein V4697_03630 [Patescibacteria group bacterium]
MIYFFHGTDVEKARGKAHDLIESLQKKKPDASFVKIDAENFSVHILDEYIGGQGLFVSKNIVFLDRLCEKKDIKEEFVGKIKEIAESENIFIVLEGKLDKVTLGKIEKKAEKTAAFDFAEKPAKKEYGAFAFADAFGKKDRKNAWMLYRKAIDGGEAPEALHGMIFWKAKTMMLAGGGYGWSGVELKKTLDDLVTVYHDSRRGVHELETGLEAFLLTM